MRTKAELLGLLADDSPEIRRRTVLDARALPAREAAEIALLALGDDDWRVRKEAAVLAAEIADTPGLTESLIAASAEEENIGLRNAAVEALSCSGSETLFRIIERASSEHPDDRRTAIEILGASRDPRAVDVLVGALRDPNSNVRACAAEWLGEFSGQRAQDALMACLRREDRLLSLVALQSLRKMSAAIPWSFLQPLEDETILGEELILALGRSGATEAVSKVMRHLKDEPSASLAMEQLHDASEEAARAVESALSSIDEETATGLSHLAAGDHAAVSRAATRCILWTRNRDHMPKIVKLARNGALYPVLLEGLKQWGDEAADALLSLLNGVEGNALASTVGLLTRLLDEATGRQQGDRFAAMLSSHSEAVATAAASAVARFGDQTVVPQLLRMVESSDRRLRVAAGTALSEIGRRHPEAVFDALREVEIAGGKGVEILRALKAIANPDAVPRVIAAMNDPIPETRKMALTTLATLSGVDAVGSVVARLADEDISVRLAAVEALALVGTAAGEAIVSELKTAEGPVACALVRALGRVGHPDAAKILGTMLHRSADIALVAVEAAQALTIPLETWQDDMFTHPDPEMVKRALAAFENNITVERLIGLARHPSWDVRLAAVRQLTGRPLSSSDIDQLTERQEVEGDDLVRNALNDALTTFRRGDRK